MVTEVKDPRTEPNIQAFRRRVWPSYRLELAQKYGVTLAEGDEPEWTGPGQARYWQRTVVLTRQPTGESDPQGRPVNQLAEKDLGWHPTAPLAVSPGVMAHYLRLGLRLHNPETEQASVEPQALGEDAPPSGGTQAMAAYSCADHAFRTDSWRSWRMHCIGKREAVGSPPQGTRQAKMRFWCPFHGIGFEQARLFKRHQSLPHPR